MQFDKLKLIMNSSLNILLDGAWAATPVLATAVLVLFAYFAYHYAGPPLWNKATVFRDMGVPYISPLKSRLQSDSLLLSSSKSFVETENEQVKQYGKVFGKIEPTGPVLIIAEPDLLRDVFVKEFNFFYNRRDVQPGSTKLFAESVFFQRGQRWHDIRSLMSPTFSSAKMRSMDGLIRDCLTITKTELDKRFLKAENKTIEIDAKNYFSNFAMDVIGTVFFGVGVDAITNREHPFVTESFKVFSPVNRWGILLAVLLPSKFVRKLLVQYGVLGLPNSTRNYFENIIPIMIRDRREAIANNVQRRDFLNFLLTARDKAVTNQELTATGTLGDDHTDDVHVNAGASDADSDSPVKQNSDQNSGRKFQKTSASTALNDDEIAGQCFIFMIAGFETTATTIGFLCHELALNQDVQDRLRAEINDVLGESKQLTYDTVAEMRFLDACATETLRLYPPVVRIERQCAEDCTLSNGLQIKKGVIVGIPAWYIQRSPDNFVDPEKFDPDRFYDSERRAQIKPYTYMPFGQGPRNCVGMRFALLELKMVTAFVVQNYRIVPTEKTVHPIKFQPRTGALIRPLGGTVVGLQTLDNSFS